MKIEEVELNKIDELLARRDALDSEPTRYDKILKCINTAKRVDKIECRIKKLEEGIKKFYRLPKIEKRAEFTSSKPEFWILITKELYEELYKLLEE